MKPKLAYWDCLACKGVGILHGDRHGIYITISCCAFSNNLLLLHGYTQCIHVRICVYVYTGICKPGQRDICTNLVETLLTALHILPWLLLVLLVLICDLVHLTPQS
jgi:hypothetical protein